MLEGSGFEVAEILGQSYCNEMCNKENDDVKTGVLSASELQEMHQKSNEEMLEDARRLAIPNDIKVDESYSYVLRCFKK